MANYRGPKCKLCRREAQKLFLKGDKCYTKCTLDKRPEAPGKAGQVGGRSSAARGQGAGRGQSGGRGQSAGRGQSGSRGQSGGRAGAGGRGPSGGGRLSDYGVRLREKQKLRRTYGILERQFRIYFQRAERLSGVTGENLLSLLERRLDNVIFRLGIAASRPHARQLVTHRLVRVNGRPVSVPSILLGPGDTVQLKERGRKSAFLQELVEGGAKREAPGWVERSPDGWSGRVLTVPSRQQIDTDVREQLIVEYYSR